MRILLVIFVIFQFSSFGQSSSENNTNLKPNFNLPGYLKLDFGFTLIENKDHSLNSDLFPSRSLDIYYSKPLFLSDDFSFNPGIGISNDRLSFSNDVILSETFDVDGNRNIIIDTLSFSPDKNSLKATYLVIPIDLRYYFGSGSYDKRRFFIGFGGEIGLLLNSSTKLKQTINNTSSLTKMKKDFGLNDLKYGISFQIGVGNFHLYYKRYLSNLFDDDSLPMYELVNPNINKIGVSFSVF